ncbi:peptidoglycan DD-metalloendopeptidase family protein [Alkalinema sp. FACHB-956]|uniref:peptidoglycan DD-metalloendopeptidase family protein n=1 Tax=Alkalinema sp. FACHB-956 TaxID=2692768 RepID=UPI0016837A3E|nr:M23 family metallopeptidase [Alkalinema sp. FACHB-956]
MKFVPMKFVVPYLPGQRRFRQLWRLMVPLLALVGTLAAIVIAQPSIAFQASVTPNNPILGDTLSVVVPGAAESTIVRMNGQTYSAFDLGNGQMRALLPTTPLDKPGPLKIQVESGADSQTLTVNLKNRSFPTQSIWLPPGQDGNVSDWEYDRVDAFKKIVSPQKLWNGKFLRPNNGPVTTGYGVRRYYNGVFANDYYHRGVDYAGNSGSAVIAPADGKVALIGYEKDGFKVHGNVIGLDHGQGVTSIYLHLSRIKVKEGDFVKAGQTIGTLGSTGASTGPHLHWGLYVHGQSIDPVPWRETGFN